MGGSRGDTDAGGSSGAGGRGDGDGGTAGTTSTGSGGASGNSGAAGNPNDAGSGAGSGGTGDDATADAPASDGHDDVAIDDAPARDVVTIRDARPDAPTCGGYALQLTGLFTYASVFRPVQDDFTIEAWINTTTSRSSQNNDFWQGLGLIYADLSGTFNDFGSSILNNKFAFGTGNPDTTLLSTSNVTTGEWVHVAATRRRFGGEIQLFVNGVMEASAIVASQIFPLDASLFLTIGGNTIDDRYYVGLLDEVRIWNLVRTPDEIRATMRHRLVGNEWGLVAYWQFDRPGGSTTQDTSTANRAANLEGLHFWTRSDAPVCDVVVDD